ncbi:MAG: hypothetical protein ABSD64_11935, partial [Terriglobales bacterium]
ARLHSLRKKSSSPLILGGAALQRCGKCMIMTAASAAEVTDIAPERLFPQPVQPCRNCSKINSGFSRWGNMYFELTHYPQSPEQRPAAPFHL